MSDVSETIDSIANAVEKIGKSSWVSVILFGFSAVLVYGAYESRTALIGVLLSNTWVLGLIASALIFWFFYQMSYRLHTASNKLVADERDRMLTMYQGLRGELDDMKEENRDLKSENKSLKGEIHDCRVECKTEIRTAMMRLEEIARGLRNAKKE